MFDHFSMNIRSLFVCSALLLFASVAYGAGSYQRTRDGKTLVWSDSPKRGEEATWSGKRDKKGYAVGSGTLTWYKVGPTSGPGSFIPWRRAVVVKRYSGKMVHGKFKGAVTYVDAKGRKRSVNLTSRDRQSPRKKATGYANPCRDSNPNRGANSYATWTANGCSNFRAHPRTRRTELGASSRAEPLARRTRNPDCSPTADGHSGT